MGVRVTGLRELEADLRAAVEHVVEDGKKVAGRAGLNVKKEAQRIIRAHSPRGYLPHYPRAISYDVSAAGTVISVEIGPRSDRLQGGLGPYIEEGTVNNAPVPHLAPALDLEEHAFYSYLEDLAERLLEGKRGEDGPVTDPGGG